MQDIEEAVCALAQVLEGREWKSMTPETQERFRRALRAALDTLRDPTEAMTEAGATVIGAIGPGESHMAHLNDAANTWRFMIDVLIGTTASADRSLFRQ